MAEVAASVIVPVHDAELTLGRQLEALAAQEATVPFEVIVVANRCTDSSVEVARSFDDRLRLRIVVADDRASAAYARNVGAATASADLLLFCDADDVVGSTWVGAMVDALSSGQFDAVGGCIRVDRRDLPDWIYRWRYDFFDGSCLRRSSGRLPYAISASLGVRRAAFDQVGGFDERFAGAGGEEVDFGWRLQRVGLRLGEAPDAVLTYTPRRSLRENLAQSRSYFRGGLILAEKEGAAPWCPTRADLVLGVARQLAYVVVRERELHPMGLYARARERHGRWREQRAWASARRRSSDAAVPPVRLDGPTGPPGADA